MRLSHLITKGVIFLLISYSVIEENCFLELGGKGCGLLNYVHAKITFTCNLVVSFLFCCVCVYELLCVSMS